MGCYDTSRKDLAARSSAVLETLREPRRLSANVVLFHITRRFAISIVFLSVALILSMSAVAAFAGTCWYASTSATTNSANPIGTGMSEVRLADGRACLIAEVSDFGGRQVVCDRGTEKVQFSVQCDATRGKDHVQVRFTSPKGEPVDFIEVGCERLDK